MTHPRFHALSDPAKPAAILAETGESLTYGALEKVANRGARLFRRLGLASGDTIAMWLPNLLSCFEIYWAAQRAGLYITPVSTQLTASEAAYILEDCGARLLVTSSAVRDAATLLCGPVPPAIATVLTMGDPIEGYTSWRQATANEPDTPIPDEQAGYHLVYSSGTTGRPKGVRLPLSGGAATDSNPLAEMVRDWYGVGPQTVYLSPAPLYHTAPLAFSTAIQRVGGTVIILAKFDAEAALAAIERYRVTFSQMVPTMFQRFLRLPAETRVRHDLSSLIALVHAAAPCPVEVKRRMLDWLGPVIYEYYGGSEGVGSTFITPEEWLNKPGSVGRANHGIVHICADDGTQLPPGEAGLIYFEGGWDFDYLNDPAKTRDARHPEHPDWSTLGDVGYLDQDGYLFLTDRKSFMIISGGVNIYPQEIENLLATFPGIADVAVIGVPSAEMGEEVKAVVEPVDWANATPEFAERILAHCRANLSHVKAPKSVDFDPSLPRHDTGKLYKREIRERYWAGHAKRIA